MQDWVTHQWSLGPVVQANYHLLSTEDFTAVATAVVNVFFYTISIYFILFIVEATKVLHIVNVPRSFKPGCNL